MNDPMEPFRTIMERVREIAEAEGLTLEGFAIVPNPDKHGPSFIQAVFGVTEEAFKSAEQRDIDDTFKTMMIQNKVESDTAKIDEIAVTGGMDLMKKMRDLNREDGIGLDDDPEDD